MGLDMYLEKHTYVKRWDHQSPEERHTVTVTKGLYPVERIKPERVSFIVEQVAYWRKTNAIHRWFVENVQDGKDDCGRYLVEREKLGELLSAVEAVLNNRGTAEVLLPTQAGFFFGGTEYDEYYFSDLERTRTTLAALLAEPEEGGLYYQSSW